MRIDGVLESLLWMARGRCGSGGRHELRVGESAMKCRSSTVLRIVVVIVVKVGHIGLIWTIVVVVGSSARAEIGDCDFSQPTMRLQFLNARTSAPFHRQGQGRSSNFTSWSTPPFARAEMASSKVRGRIVVHIVLLALLALLADVKSFLGLEGRLLWLNAYPDTLHGRVYVLPVALKFVGSSESDGAVGTWEGSLRLVVRW